MKPTARVVSLPQFDRMRIKQGGLNRAAMAGGQVIEAYAKINVNETFSSKSTGGAGLAGSIQTVLIKSGDQYAEVAVGPSVVYGRIHELGGWIRAVHAKALHFVIDGMEFFKQAVYIPARPYLRPAADEHQDEILAAVGASLEQDVWKPLI